MSSLTCPCFVLNLSLSLYSSINCWIRFLDAFFTLFRLLPMSFVRRTGLFLTGLTGCALILALSISCTFCTSSTSCTYCGMGSLPPSRRCSAVMSEMPCWLPSSVGVASVASSSSQMLGKEVLSRVRHWWTNRVLAITLGDAASVDVDAVRLTLVCPPSATLGGLLFLGMVRILVCR